MNIVKKGDLVFVQGKGIIAKIIRYFDKGTFSHVAIAVSNHDVIEADVDTKVAIRPFLAKNWNVIEVIDLGLTDEQRGEVFESAFELLGTRYDYIQLLWYAFKKVFKLNGRNRLNNPHYVICSELVFIALDKSGILKDLGIADTFKNGTDLTPNQLYDLVKYVSKK